MSDCLDILAENARSTIDSEYYETAIPGTGLGLSLHDLVLRCRALPIIAEVKAASPSSGTIRRNFDAADIATSMQKGGAVALSVLTEPKKFEGSLANLSRVRQAVSIPILMKDFVLSPRQIQAAWKAGANAVLLIQALFDRGYCDLSLKETISLTHSLGLEVLLETHTQEEFQSAVKTEADLIGINNRDLASLTVNLNVTRDILSKNSANGKLVVSESGIKTINDVRFLRDCGARAFLIGSTIMSNENIEEKVKEFVYAK